MYKFELIDPFLLPHCGCNLRLSLASGEVLVLLGDNGLGKTTIMHRFHQQYEASAYVEQKPLDFFFERSLSKIKHFFLHSGLAHFNQERFLELWELFRLNEKESRFISQLSGGEAQGLKLCLILSKDCALYFLDEPSQFLDQTRKNALGKILEKMKQQGKSLLIIEHDKDWFPSGWTLQTLEIQNQQISKGPAWTT
jgi:ABC-type multidrug transport system ATPase subunit